MSSNVKILPNYTYKDYQQWEGRWELIGGIPFAMSPLPAPIHQKIANKVSSEFYIQLKNCNHCEVYQPLDYLISNDTVLQPDMLVVCAEIPKKFLDFPPSLVTEILSPSTALKDRHNKFSIYESQNIPYYIIISTDPEEIEIYQIERGFYQLKEKGRDFSFEFDFDPCKALIDFNLIW